MHRTEFIIERIDGLMGKSAECATGTRDRETGRKQSRIKIQV